MSAYTSTSSPVPVPSDAVSVVVGAAALGGWEEVFGQRSVPKHE